MSRADLQPASSLPLAYFALAHASLACAALVLVINPDLPAGFFLHPRMVAVVHLVTLAWISGSILGAFYIVAPLALGMPLPAGRGDWLGFGSFAIGVSGMISHFWMGEYNGMAWSAGMVIVPIAWLGARAARRFTAARVPWPVTLHVGLAFANILAAAALGTWLGLARAFGWIVPGASPFATVFAHAHIAAVGWALMMIVGLAYRLLPMFLPATPPTGGGLAVSAVLLELGLAAVVAGLVWDGAWLAPGALAIAGGLAAFVRNVRGMLARRLPRPPALPRRDWSTWQTHGALAWLAVALGLGVWLTVMPAGPRQIAVAWTYGVAGLLGGLSQMVTGMQGRLVPLYAYYRAMAARGGAPPGRAANALPSSRFAAAIFLCWTVAVPWLAWGLANNAAGSIRGASAVLLAGVLTGAAYMRYLMKAAGALHEHRC